MPRIPPPHVFAHIRPCPSPETGQIAGDGDWAAGGGEQGELQFYAAGAEFGGFAEAVEGLGAGGGDGDWLFVIDGGAAAGQIDMGGEVAIEAVGGGVAHNAA